MQNKNIYFETIRCSEGKAYFLQYHQNRIRRTIGYSFDLAKILQPPSHTLLRCKVIYDKYNILDISYTPYEKKEVVKFEFVYDDNISYDKKLLDRTQIDNLKTTNNEIIIVKNGYITDTSIANIAIYENNRWITPKNPLLLGTTRKRYIDSGLLVLDNITPQRVKKANKIALMNAMVDFYILDYFNL